MEKDTELIQQRRIVDIAKNMKGVEPKRLVTPDRMKKLLQQLDQRLIERKKDSL